MPHQGEPLLFATAFFGLLLSGVVFLQTEWHYSALRSALATAPGPLVVILLARPAGKLAVRLGHRRVLLAGAVAWCVGSGLLAVQAGGSAINASFRQLGAVLGVSIFVAVQSSAGPAAYVGAFHHVWWAFAALGLAAGIVVWL